METLTPHRKRLAGFSLIELAIVLFISGILMSAGITLFMAKMAAAQVEVTQKRQEAIKQALINYLGQYKRLPCPGDSSGAELVRNAAPPPCPSYSGIVPYKELGLDRTAALDGWENFITYVVSPYLNAAALPAPPPSTPPWITAWLYTFQNGATQTTTITPTGSLAFWPSTSTGGIKVTTDGTNPIADPATATGAAVVLISHGKNGSGAYNVKGQKNAAPPAPNTYEVQNTSISDAAPSVVKRDTADSSPGGPFDDVVMLLSANDLTGPLIANGTLQSNAQAALSQANDIVMGNIVTTRLCVSCVAPITYGYTIPPTITFTTPPNVVAWGVSYTTQPATPIDATTPPSNQIAYTLTAGDGSTKTVLIQELRGILTRGAGF